MALMQRSPADRSALLSQAWSNVADPYSRELVPRFDPWTQATLELFSQRQTLPPGNIWVPACGPGQELEPLAAAFPGHTIVGADLAPQMVALAQRGIAASPHRPRLAVEVADCAAVPQRLQPLAGIFSCFGLQQLMPSPAASLLAWYQALQPGGVAAVIYWPALLRQTEAAWNALTDAVVMRDQAAHAPEPVDWEADIPAAATEAGAALLADRLQAFPMRFDSPAHFFEVMVHAGPLQARLLALGPARLAAQKAAFLQRFSSSGGGGGGGADGAFVVRPCARTVVLRKPKEAKL